MTITVLQPTVPSYRIGFFSRLAELSGQQFTVYASAEDMGVLSKRASRPSWERPLGPTRRLLPGVDWQARALSIAIAPGDVVVVCGAPRCLSTLAVLLKARVKGARTIWWGHYWSSTSRPWRAGLRILLMQFSDAILFYTDQEVEEYRAARGGHRKPVLALNNGIETEEIVRLREPYLPASRLRDILFIGRLTSKANLDLLLEALSLPACAATQLDVIGSGEEEASLLRRCAELGIADRVAWHGGIINERRIAEIANACKVFVYPGSVGLSLIHGFAYGLPAVVHDDRWHHMPEIAALRTGENGATFKQGDAASLSQAIAALLADPERLSAMSAAATATTAHSFNAADMAERFCKAIRSVQSGRQVLDKSTGEVAP